MTDVTADVLAIIQKKIPKEDKSIAVGDSLEELGLESVDFLEMVFDVEEKFDVQIDYNANTAAEDFKTVQDVVNAIQELVDKKG